MTRVAVLDDYQRIAPTAAYWRGLPAGVEVDFFTTTFLTSSRPRQRLQPYDVIVSMRERNSFSRKLLEQLPRLRLLTTTGISNAAIDIAAAADLNIVVCGTFSTSHGTVEITWGHILALLRQVVAEDRSIRAGGWQTKLGVDLEGKTLGILGLGKIGTRVAVIGHAFGMRTVAWSQNLNAETAETGGAEWLDKDEFFRQADVISIHLRLSERTRGLVGAHELGLMKTTAILVNTSRGPIVDEAALIKSLSEGRIAGAGLDVFDEEPLPTDHPLRRLENTVLTPHIGYVTQNVYRNMFEQTVENITAFLAGKPVRVLSTSNQESG